MPAEPWPVTHTAILFCSARVAMSCRHSHPDPTPQPTPTHPPPLCRVGQKGILKWLTKSSNRPRTRTPGAQQPSDQQQAEQQQPAQQQQPVQQQQAAGQQAALELPSGAAPGIEFDLSQPRQPWIVRLPLPSAEGGASASQVPGGVPLGQAGTQAWRCFSKAHAEMAFDLLLARAYLYSEGEHCQQESGAGERPACCGCCSRCASGLFMLERRLRRAGIQHASEPSEPGRPRHPCALFMQWTRASSQPAQCSCLTSRASPLRCATAWPTTSCQRCAEADACWVPAAGWSWAATLPCAAGVPAALFTGRLDR